MKRERVRHFIAERETIIVVGLLGMALLMGLIYSISLGDTIRFADEREYHRIAENLVEKHAFILWSQPTAWRPPAYPYFLAFWIWLGAGVVHLRLVHILLLGLTGFLVYTLLKKESSPFAATLGMGCVLFYPLFFYTAGTLYPQTLATTILVLAINSYFRSETPCLSNLVVTGICLGILMLITPSFSFVLLFFCAWIFFGKDSIRGRVRSILILGLASLLIVGPWIVRNYRVFHAFVFVSTNGGENLLMGNCENTTGTSGVVDISQYSQEAETRGLGEVGRDRFYRQKAVEYIRAHPLHSIKLYGLKFLNYFNFRNTLRTPGEASRWTSFLALITYGPLLLGGIILRLALVRKIPLTRFDAFLLLLYVLNGAFAAVFFTRIRFRVPFDALLICEAAYFIDRWISLKRGSVGSLPPKTPG